MDRKNNVLIIEDSKDDVELYANIIRQLFPCNITHFTSAENALTVLENIDQYDLILIDYNLPGMNGVNFLQLVKQKKVTLSGPIIVLTGHGNEDVAVNFIRLGITDYIQKNQVNHKSLSSLIHQALEKYHIRLREQENYSNYNILIIEDSIDDLELYERIIKKTFNCAVTHFGVAEKAIESLEQGNQYDLILVDYNLPGIDGIDFLKLIRQRKIDPRCPVIVLTGQGNEEIAINFMRLGITDYIQKNHINFDSLSSAMQNALEKYQIKKIRQEKHKELLFFAHTLAHDLKSPISRMQSYCRLLKLKTQKQSSYIENIEEDANFLMKFIDKLLVYAEFGRSPAEKQEVDLNTVLQKSITNLETDIAGRNATINIAGGLPTINGSEVSLIQLFQNIISNSIKYSVKNPVIEITPSIQNNTAVISIMDNGIGIPEDEVMNIFKPFTRVQNMIEAPGTGLGLALVKTIADQHHATIDIASRQEGGTRFDITFLL